MEIPALYCTLPRYISAIPVCSCPSSTSVFWHYCITPSGDSQPEHRKKNREAEDLTEALSDGTFDEDEDLTAWCAGLSEACPRHTVGCLGIDSDSYVIFPVQKQILDQLQQAAGQIGQKITPAENG